MKEKIFEIIGIIVGLITTYLAGFAVGPLLEHSTKNINLSLPEQVYKGTGEQWKKIAKVSGPCGKWIGELERILFFATFWASAYIVIAGWLTFKVASQWEAWHHIVRVPESIEGIPPLSYLEARNEWASLRLTRFLVGTLANILIGLLGFIVGKNSIEVIKFLFSPVQ